MSRSIDMKRYYKPNADEAGLEPIYNKQALCSGQPVFITEGVIDALSIIEVGGQAISIGGTCISKLLNLINSKRPSSKLLLNLDNDDVGRTITNRLAMKFKILSVAHMYTKISGDYKNHNYALILNRANFWLMVNQYIEDSIRPDSARNYLNNKFVSDIDGAISNRTRKTGFEKLDVHTNGLYSGLYVIGAISSLGKTTFIHEIAEKLIGSGEHVMFFSLEQSQFELISKSICRVTAKRDYKTVLDSIQVRTSEPSAQLKNAIGEYNKIASRISIV